MRSDKFKAYQLRASGRSYAEIRRLLKIPKSTLSTWFTGLVLSDEATARIKRRVQEKSLNGLIKRNVRQTHLAEERSRKARNKARSSIGTLTRRDLLILGASLYWAEGYKRLIVRKGKARTYHPVCLTNSDPNLIKMFLRFLREVCLVKEESIRASIRIFDHQNEAYILDFWQKISKIPYSQFDKPYKGVSISSQRKKTFNTLPYGTIQIRVGSTDLFHRIMGYIEGLK